uniref:Proline-rich receptor-like protein kinase PERK2 n=1 Tax=Nicotiana sylvestris TaxID=4096 RepID=A0A1U7Y844_NICSY|nr:PREDICTED: proline-rich receptor-like protein kinase PERK2 [Nicotiana sylvestris]
MSNQQRPFSWFRLAPFGRQLQPAPAPTPRPPALRAPAPQPFRPPAPQPRPTIRPPPPAVTSPPPPTRALFPGITTTAAARSPTTSTAPPSPAKSIPAATSVPSSPAATSTFLPITSSSFTLRSPETKTRAPPSSSLTTSPFPKPVASPPKTATPTAPTTTVTASTTATTTLSTRTIKPFKESPQQYPETRPLFRPPPPEKEPKRAPLVEETKKLMLGQEATGNSSKMNGKATTDNKKVTELKILPRRLVTLTGENKGAIMVLSPNSTKKSYTNGFGGKSQTVGGNKEEGQTHVKGSNKKKEDQSEMNAMEMEESTLFINSNVQGVNNSILDDSSLTHHDPGFHIFFSAD